jgi:hypothetical protein
MTEWSGYISWGRSQWMRSLRCGSATPRLTGLWVRISLGSCWVACNQVEVSEFGWSFVQRSPKSVLCPMYVIARALNERTWPGSNRRRKNIVIGSSLCLNMTTCLNFILFILSLCCKLTSLSNVQQSSSVLESPYFKSDVGKWLSYGVLWCCACLYENTEIVR